jgi:hypothetical protein
MIRSPKYCIDTSALIEGFHRTYPAHIFTGLWEKIGGLVAEGVLISPEQVYRELEKQEDDLFEWAKERRGMFITSNMDQLTVTFRIAAEFPQLSRSKTSSNEADPWVIALAEVRRCAVVTEEKRGSPQSPKIPQICLKYHLRTMKILQMIREEGWTFPLCDSDPVEVELESEP